MDEAGVRKIAQLAKLEVDEADLPRLAGELDRILGYVERLRAADLAGLSESEPESRKPAAIREDAPRISFTPKEATENAPEAEDGVFLVPRVIG